LDLQKSGAKVFIFLNFAAYQAKMIIARSIKKSYGSLNVLKGISLETGKGEIISIVGASGAGKSTFLHIIGTLDSADSGYLELNGIRVHELPHRKLSDFRNKQIGFIFQFHHLLPEFTAVENICIPAFIAGKGKKEAESRAMELLDIMNLKERAHHKPSELSGGEQQRVAVARALVNNPPVILADEPSGNLDSTSAIELHNLFFQLRDLYSQTYVIVTHNLDLANMADRKLTIRDGMIDPTGEDKIN
jgi:lipoprotein-releasing system ATP-binding protein